MKNLKYYLGCCKKIYSNKTIGLVVFISFATVLTGAYFAFMTAGEDISITSTIEINDTTTNGPTLSDDDYYGWSVVNIGDLDNDGVDDIAVGVYEDDTGSTDAGAIYIHFMNSDQSIKSTVKIDDSTANGPVLDGDHHYGMSIAALGDLDGDTVEDIAVGADMNCSKTCTGIGAVYIHYLNTDGSVKSTVQIDETTTNGASLAGFDYYGSSITYLGDLDGDGVGDIAVGAPGDDAGLSAAGAIHIHYMNTDGSIDSTVEINKNTANGASALALGDQYGSSITLVGDLDGDGVDDIAVGAPGDDYGGFDRGAMHLHYMNTDGSIDSTVVWDHGTTNMISLGHYSAFGLSSAGIGDFDGDGVEDIIVGAVCQDDESDCLGTAHILFLDTDGSIKSTYSINSTIENGPTLAVQDYYGTSVALLGDIDSNGYVDIAVGAPYDAAGGTGRGAIHISYLTIASISSSAVQPSPGMVAFKLESPNSCFEVGGEVLLSASGNNIDQFVIADNELFQEAEWGYIFEIPSIQSWTFDTPGVHTLYALFKNNNGNRTGIYTVDVVVQESCSSGQVNFPVGIEAGDIIKLEYDRNESILSDTVVYYVGTDGMRYAFMNEAAFFSWYDSFEMIKVVDQTVFDAVPNNGMIMFKPGSMVKYPDSTEVYFVDSGQVLRHIASEAIATAMFGDRWAVEVFDISKTWAYTEFGSAISGLNVKLLESVKSATIEENIK